MPTKQLIPGAIGATYLPTASTVYTPPLYGIGTMEPTDARNDANGSIVPTAGTLGRLHIEVTAAPGAGKSWTFNLLKNGSSTDVSITISDTDTQGYDDEATLSVSAQDVLHLEIVPSGTPAANQTAAWVMEWTPSADGEYIYGGNSANTQVASNYYTGWYSNGLPTSGELNCTVAPIAGTLSKLALQAHYSIGGNMVITARVNGSATSLVATITGGGGLTKAIDTVNTADVAAGDYLTYKFTTGSLMRFAWACVFVPDDPSEYFLAGECTSSSTGSSTTYYIPSGHRGAATGGEQVHLTLSGHTATGMRVRQWPACGAGKSRTWTVRQDYADTSIALTISGASDYQGEITGQSVELDDWSWIGIKSVPTNSPANTGYPSMSVIIEAAAGTVDLDIEDVSTAQAIDGVTLVEFHHDTDSVPLAGVVTGGAETSAETNDQVDIVAEGGIVTGGPVVEQSTQPNAVVVTPGTYRISGTIYTLPATGYYEGIGDIAAMVQLSAPPATTNRWRYDVVSVDDGQVITVTEGTESATPTVPDTPSGEVKLAHILRYYGQSRVDQADINATWIAPALAAMTATASDAELSWGETTSTITINLYDQYGNAYRTSTVISSSFVQGNGTLTPQSRSTTTGAAAFTYTRGGADPGDSSPTIKFEVASGPLAVVSITLLDAGGLPMF